METMISLLLLAPTAYAIGKVACWVARHECVVGPHWNGRCGVCGGSMPESPAAAYNRLVS